MLPLFGYFWSTVVFDLYSPVIFLSIKIQRTQFCLAWSSSCAAPDGSSSFCLASDLFLFFFVSAPILPVLNPSCFVTTSLPTGLTFAFDPVPAAHPDMQPDECSNVSGWLQQTGLKLESVNKKHHMIFVWYVSSVTSDPEQLVSRSTRSLSLWLWRMEIYPNLSIGISDVPPRRRSHLALSDVWQRRASIHATHESRGYNLPSRGR